MTNAQNKRGDALQALYVKYPSDQMFSRKTLAADIRALSILGRTEHWRGRIEQWAQMVEDIENTLIWAYQQGSVYAAYAI